MGANEDQSGPDFEFLWASTEHDSFCYLVRDTTKVILRARRGKIEENTLFK